MMVPGIGIGLLFPSMALGNKASGSVKDIAIAAAMFTFFRCLGQTVGVAVGGLVSQIKWEANLAAYPSLAGIAIHYSLDVVSLIRTINSLPSQAPETIILKDALSHSIRTIWTWLCGFSGVVGVASTFLRHFDLDQVLATEQGFEGMGAKKLGFEVRSGRHGKEGMEGEGREIVENRD